MQPATILFVDDESFFLRSTRRLFSPPHRVVTADRPMRGLEAVRNEKFDVVVSDYRMPEMTGVEFLERVREIRPEAVSILVTAVHDFDAVVAAVNRGSIFRFVSKPFEINELEDAVNAAVDLAHLREERDRLAAQLVQRNDELARFNSMLEATVRERTGEVLHALVDALDYRDSETQAHSRRVSVYARRVAELMGISGQQLLAVEAGALLHDVGKLAVPDGVLLKQGPLNPEEWAEMRKHAMSGWQLVRRISFLEDAAMVCKEHHERWDGKGYPQGLSGEQICIGARIFSVVDTYDAITSDRPYRKGRSSQIARDEIARCAGTQFDPKVAKVFLSIGEDEIARLREKALAGFGNGWTGLEGKGTKVG